MASKSVPPVKVLAGGCFDLLHYGHIQFFKKAKHFGDQLIILLESDASIAKTKGPNRPLHNQRQRAQMLKSVKYVDQVVSLSGMLTDQDYIRIVQRIKPQIIAVTAGDPVLDKKSAQARLVGAKIVIIPKISTLSTTDITRSAI